MFVLREVTTIFYNDSLFLLNCITFLKCCMLSSLHEWLGTGIKNVRERMLSHIFYYYDVSYSAPSSLLLSAASASMSPRVVDAA